MFAYYHAPSFVRQLSAIPSLFHVQCDVHKDTEQTMIIFSINISWVNDYKIEDTCDTD